MRTPAKKPSQGARITELEQQLSFTRTMLADLGRRFAELEKRVAPFVDPAPRSKREMDAFDALPAAAREEVRQYGLDDLPKLLDMLDRGEITTIDFMARIRRQAGALGLKRESPEPMRKRVR